MMPLLSFQAVTLSFGGLSVVDRLDMDVAHGSRTAMIGPNGAGKTTVFNLISGVYRPTSGRIAFEGEPINDVPLDRRVYLGIGRTFQNLRLMKHLTVLENVLLGQHRHVGLLARYLMPLNSRANAKLVDEALHIIEVAGIRDDAYRLADGLPYGVQKRVEIARALVTRPKLLMLDEPAAGLNSSERQELSHVLRTAIAPSVTMLIVEHDIGFVRALCDHVVALNFGLKIAEGSAANVCKDPAVIEAYLGKDEEDEASLAQAKGYREPELQRGGHAA